MHCIYLAYKVSELHNLLFSNIVVYFFQEDLSLTKSETYYKKRDEMNIDEQINDYTKMQ